jgi:hypothetical protein
VQARVINSYYEMREGKQEKAFASFTSNVSKRVSEREVLTTKETAEKVCFDFVKTRRKKLQS